MAAKQTSTVDVPKGEFRNYRETEGRRYADRLAQILNWKHSAEYEPKRATEREARDFAKIVERLIDWVQRQLP